MMIAGEKSGRNEEGESSLLLLPPDLTSSPFFPAHFSSVIAFCLSFM